MLTIKLEPDPEHKVGADQKRTSSATHSLREWNKPAL